MLKYDSRLDSNADYAVNPHVAMQCVTSTPALDVAPDVAPELLYPANSMSRAKILSRCDLLLAVSWVRGAIFVNDWI